MNKYILLILFCFFINVTLKAQETKEDNKKHWTISHKLLQMEENAFNQKGIDYSEMYNLIDSVISISSKKINSIKKNNTIINESIAIDILNAIEESLTELNFIVCYRTERLNQALIQTRINKSLLDFFKIRDKRENNNTIYYFDMYGERAICMTKKRLEYFNNNSTNYFYTIDCDLGAFLYLGIAEVNNLPIYLVEVPGHNFIRYQIDKNTFINWDNNSANIFSNEDFKKGLSPTISRKFQNSEIISNNYLTNMTNDEVLGYHYENVARYSIENLEFKNAETQLDLAIKLRPYSASARNELSWMYLTNKKFNKKKYSQKALILSKEVDSINSKNLDYKDTFACACAAEGYFNKAIEIERQAYDNPEKIEAFKNKITCLELGLK